MNIIIVGAGQVGSSLAKNLQTEHDISLIDTNPEKLRSLQSKYDIKTICGSGAHPHILEKAGAADADLILAVSNIDEVNIIACQVSYSLFRTPMKLARLRDKSYRRYPQMFNNNNIPIDHIINPSEVVTNRLVRLIEHPGSFQVLDFTNGRIQMLGATLHSDSGFVGLSIREFRQELPDIDARIVAIFRRKRAIVVSAEVILNEDDDVFFTTERENTQTILSEFQPLQKRVKKIFIAGGGNVGMSLAQKLENRYLIKIVEHNSDNCHKIAENLNNSIVLSGDASDAELLEAESIDETDLFCSVTNDDEANIMSAMLAKKMGAKSVIAIVNSMSYAALIDEGHVVDRALSPQRTTIGVILTYLRKGDMKNIYSVYSGQAEAMEAVVHGDPESSPIVGKMIKEIELPLSVRIGAVVKNDVPLIAHDDIVIEQGDHVIMCISNLKDVKDIENLFQVSPTFI